jgi:hypothetical protein
MLTRCQHYPGRRSWVRCARPEATGVPGRALLTSDRTCVIGEVPDQTPSTLADDDWDAVSPNGFAGVALGR